MSCIFSPFLPQQTPNIPQFNLFSITIIIIIIISRGDLADCVVNTAPAQWLHTQLILKFIETVLPLIAKTRSQPNPFASLKGSKTYSPQQVHKVLTNWLFQNECVYLSMIVPSYTPSKAPPTNFSFLFNEDSALLVLEYVIAEYQTVLYEDINNLSQSNTSTTSTKSNNNIETPSIQSNTTKSTNTTSTTEDEKLDLSVLLHAKQHQPSLSQSYQYTLHNLQSTLLDIEMFMTSLDLQHTPGSTLSTEQEEYYSKQAMLAISPPSQQTFSPVTISSIDQRLTAILSYFSQQSRLYAVGNALEPIISSMGKYLLSSSLPNRLFDYFNKTQFSKLSPTERKIVLESLQQFQQEYIERHNRLLQKMLTQTQTFLFSLKLKYTLLQQQQQNQGNDKGNKKAPVQKQQPKKKEKKIVDNKGPKKKPVEDGADEEFDSDDDDGIDWSAHKGHYSSDQNVDQLTTIDNKEYLSVLNHIVSKFTQTIKLISYLTPIHISDLFIVSKFVSLVLSHGNEKQLHRPRAKFQLKLHPRMNSLGIMADRGGRINVNQPKHTIRKF